MDDSPVFALFSKYPQEGFCKTRLGQKIGPPWAVKFQKAFLQDFFCNLQQYKNFEKLFMAITPFHEQSKKYFHELCTSHDFSQVAFFPQKEKLSFWERIQDFFLQIKETPKGQNSFIHLTGSDIPDFPFHFLPQGPSINLLGKKNVTLGPDRDGGIYYLGTHVQNYPIFNFSGTNPSHVCDDLIKKIQSEGLEVNLLPPWNDIDILDDLKKTIERTNNKIIPNTLKIFHQLEQLAPPKTQNSAQ